MNTILDFRINSQQPQIFLDFAKLSHSGCGMILVMNLNRRVHILKWIFRLLLIFATLIPGMLFYLILPKIVCNLHELHANYAGDVANIVSTFSVAFIGLLATTIVIVTNLPKSYFASVYNDSEHRKNFLLYYYFTIICLFITHTLSVVSISDLSLFRVMLASIVMNAVQILFIIGCIFSIIEKARSSAPKNT